MLNFVLQSTISAFYMYTLLYMYTLNHHLDTGANDYVTIVDNEQMIQPVMLNWDPSTYIKLLVPKV